MGEKLSVALTKVIEARSIRDCKDEAVFGALSVADELIRAFTAWFWKRGL